MKFKNAQAAADYKIMPFMLRKIVDDFEAQSLFYGVEPVVTRIREGVCGDSGVHQAGRALDSRDQVLMPDGVWAKLYTLDQVTQICESINAKFKRDDGKPTCMHHSFNGGPMHFHFQIPASWLRVGEPVNSL